MSFKLACCTFGLVWAVVGFGCGSTGPRGPVVSRIGADEPIDLSGKWNAADAKLASKSLINECFSAPWQSLFVQEEGRRPAVRVRSVVNKTDEHIDAQVFIKNIERALLNSGKVSVLAQAGAELRAVEAEQDHAISGRQSDDTAVSVGNEAGADFVVSIRISSILDQIAGKKMKFYKINIELLSSSSGEKAWIGDFEIKKLISQDRVAW